MLSLCPSCHSSFPSLLCLDSLPLYIHAFPVVALSAAHCENLEHPFDTRLFLMGLQTGTGILRTIETQVAHPLYEGDGEDYDYLILKLHKSALVDENTGTPTGATIIAINRDPNIPAPGDALLAVGYGLLNPNDQDTAKDLHEVEVQCISNDVCQQQYSREFVQDFMFCSGVEGGGKDTCQGDSGGPIIHKETGVQVGAVSFGIGCAQANYYGVNTRLSAAQEWIDSKVCELSSNPPARCAGMTTTSESQNIMPTGTGKLSIRITHDDYPEEQAWSLTYLGPSPAAGEVGFTNVNPLGASGNAPTDGYTNQVQLFMAPFMRNDIVQDRATVTESFANLPAGRYAAQFGDMAGDGMCCVFGSGKLELLDSTNAVIWENGGTFKSYIAAIFDMDSAGRITLVKEEEEYNNSWEAFTAINHPPTFDAEWPGPMPVATRNSIMVNIKFDSKPLETFWELHSNADGGGGWELRQSEVGSGVGNDLMSMEVDNLIAGWHRFRITDSGSNGICCQDGRGWVSLTGPLITTQQSGLVWGNNGEFGSSIEIYVEMDSQGLVGQVSYDDPLTAATTTTRSAVRRRKDDNDRRRQRHLTGSLTDLPTQQLKMLPSQ
jgi:trypsin